MMKEREIRERVFAMRLTSQPIGGEAR